MGKYYTLAEKVIERGRRVLHSARLEVKGRSIEEVATLPPKSSGIILPTWEGELYWALAAEDPGMKQWLEDAEKTGATVPVCSAMVPFRVDRSVSPEGRLPRAHLDELRQVIGQQFCQRYGIE